ncbi:substrate-binding domain-containing protein [Streptomyces sp. HC307]|uniref:substrate-binding domain-containing protein n=1 Tax=Streptomyces flavusporus TaxID=3385496 RepID=UPI00391724EC
MFLELEHPWSVEIIRGVERVARRNRVGGGPAHRHDQQAGPRLLQRPGCRVTRPLSPTLASRRNGLVVRTQLTREHGYTAAREVLSRPDRPSAVFTAYDMQAVGVYQAARELGLRIPHNLSVVGFDDVPAVARMDPLLTTAHQPPAEMATAATELAPALGRGEAVPQIGLEIATTLTVRDSTAPPEGE